MKKRNFIQLFDRKQSRIDSRIKRDYIENGIATVHCCISGYNDIINTYSAKDQESLNPDFVEYLQEARRMRKKLSRKLFATIFLTSSVSSKRNRIANSNYSCSC